MDLWLARRQRLSPTRTAAAARAEQSAGKRDEVVPFLLVVTSGALALVAIRLVSATIAVAVVLTVLIVFWSAVGR
ncbi:MAG TPA: hypothetical protein VE441_12390 [Mycobacterium sp.]|nr:hypothetical protein [Mycobacterium sp.]